MKNRLTSSLYKKFSTPVLKFILKRNGGDLQLAEQIVQDTFVSLISSFHTFHRKSTYFTWLCKIALNKLTDYYRDQVHRNSRFVVPTAIQLDKLVSPQLLPEEKLAMEELQVALARCLNLLPPEYRRLLQLKYYEELSSREICLKLNLTPRKLEGKLYRARKSLGLVVSRLYPDLKS